MLRICFKSLNAGYRFSTYLIGRTLTPYINTNIETSCLPNNKPLELIMHPLYPYYITSDIKNIRQIEESNECKEEDPFRS